VLGGADGVPPLVNDTLGEPLPVGVRTGEADAVVETSADADATLDGVPLIEPDANADTEGVADGDVRQSVMRTSPSPPDLRGAPPTPPPP
jgi:hypothetical protein